MEPPSSSEVHCTRHLLTRGRTHRVSKVNTWNHCKIQHLFSSEKRESTQPKVNRWSHCTVTHMNILIKRERYNPSKALQGQIANNLIPFHYHIFSADLSHIVYAIFSGDIQIYSKSNARQKGERDNCKIYM